MSLKPPSALNIAELTTMELDALPDIDWIEVASGTRKNSEKYLQVGDNVVIVWQGGPAKLIIEHPFTYDEFVLVLKGELVLTDTEGNENTYRQGDVFVVPKGFQGTWDMTKEYRELVVIDKTLHDAEFEARMK